MIEEYPNRRCYALYLIQTLQQLLYESERDSVQSSTTYHTKHSIESLRHAE